MKYLSLAAVARLFIVSMAGFSDFHPLSDGFYLTSDDGWKSETLPVSNAHAYMHKIKDTIQHCVPQHTFKKYFIFIISFIYFFLKIIFLLVIVNRTSILFIKNKNQVTVAVFFKDHQRVQGFLGCTKNNILFMMVRWGSNSSTDSCFRSQLNPSQRFHSKLLC